VPSVETTTAGLETSEISTTVTTSSSIVTSGSRPVMSITTSSPDEP